MAPRGGLDAVGVEGVAYLAEAGGVSEENVLAKTPKREGEASAEGDLDEELLHVEDVDAELVIEFVCAGVGVLALINGAERRCCQAAKYRGSCEVEAACQLGCLGRAQRVAEEGRVLRKCKGKCGF